MVSGISTRNDTTSTDSGRPLGAPAPAAKTKGTGGAVTADAILKHPALAALAPKDRGTARTILELAATSPRRGYYLTKLKLLLDTPYRDPAAAAPTAAAGPARSFEDRQLATLDDSLRRAAALVAKVPENRRPEYVTAEEQTVKGIDRKTWETRPAGVGDKVFWVSRRDPDNIVVVLNVHLQGKPEIERKVMGLEDVIEKHIKIRGFTVDLRFVDHSQSRRRDVVVVQADPKEWTTALNWVGTYENLAHELMHALGLVDEYDYIESHAANANMTMGARLHWFAVQMQKPPVPTDAQQGIMSCRGKTLRRHARAVAGLPMEAPAHGRGGVAVRPQTAKQHSNRSRSRR